MDDHSKYKFLNIKFKRRPSQTKQTFLHILFVKAQQFNSIFDPRWDWTGKYILGCVIVNLNKFIV